MVNPVITIKSLLEAEIRRQQVYADAYRLLKDAEYRLEAERHAECCIALEWLVKLEHVGTDFDFPGVLLDAGQTIDQA